MSFFRYPGGKAKLYSAISKCLAAYDNIDHYIEPFFGGGSVGLRFIAENPHLKRIWFNDINPALICLWISVLKYPEELKKLIREFRPTTKKFYIYKEWLEALNVVPNNPHNQIMFGFLQLAIHQISYSGLCYS